jgi:hypothetical protein
MVFNKNIKMLKDVRMKTVEFGGTHRKNEI